MLRPIPRTLFSDEHDQFRRTARLFVEREVLPHVDAWEADGIVSRELWERAGSAGLLGISVPEQYGGGGTDDYRFNMVLDEELARCGHASVALSFVLHNDLISPYLIHLGNEEQKLRWLPKVCSGVDGILAIAMTEPGTGSDLAGVGTTAIRDGDHYVVNGAKTFISNGILGDLVVTVVKTDPRAGARGISLLVLERGMEGFERGRNLEKVGLHAQDTAELFFTDVHVPTGNLLGEEGQGFGYLMRFLVQERIATALGAVNNAELYLEWTTAYCAERKAFGQAIGSFQNSRFVLAEIATEVQIARVFVDRCVEQLLAGELTTEQASMAKWWCTELRKRVVDQCVQLHGGYGYMLEYPIARGYIDSRVETIYAGTTEIMKEIIGRGMGF